jgi:hypothetical protein
VTVPAALVQRMKQVGNEAAEAEEGIQIACELGNALRPLVQGLHVSAPSGRFDLALRTLENL